MVSFQHHSSAQLCTPIQFAKGVDDLIWICKKEKKKKKCFCGLNKWLHQWWAASGKKYIIHICQTTACPHIHSFIHSFSLPCRHRHRQLPHWQNSHYISLPSRLFSCLLLFLLSVSLSFCMIFQYTTETITQPLAGLTTSSQGSSLLLKSFKKRNRFKQVHYNVLTQIMWISVFININERILYFL